MSPFADEGYIGTNYCGMGDTDVPRNGGLGWHRAMLVYNTAGWVPTMTLTKPKSERRTRTVTLALGPLQLVGKDGGGC